jgi:cellulose synthase/poly-beta-1,6-N-acetylglucosamine synthase-like glycosyltransferase
MKPLADPKVSVIIPTYNRKGELQTLLHSLSNQTFPANHFEVIVIDDGSTDGTREWLLEHKNQYGVAVSLYDQEHSNPGTARNKGMVQARGAIFAFIDTDCIPQPEWLEHLTNPFRMEEVGAVGGSEMIKESDPLLMRCFHYLMTASLTTGGLRGKKGKRLANFYPRTFNMAISRKAYQVAGSFKEMFYGEDLDLSYRIKQKGFALLYEDSARVYHKRRSTVAQFVRQLFNMGKARVTLARLHPGSLEPLHVLPAAALCFFMLLACLAVFWQPALTFFRVCCTVGMLFLIILGTDASLKLHSLKAFFSVPFLFVCQQSSYGLGFISSLIHRK